MKSKLYVVDIGITNVNYPWTADCKEDLREGLKEAIEEDKIDPSSIRIFVVKDVIDGPTVKVVKPCIPRDFVLKPEFEVYE